MAKKIIIKTAEQIEGIRKSCRLAADTLVYIGSFLNEGVSTEFLDKKIDEYIRDHGALPAPLHYQQFPKSCCISVNEVVCHGIPSGSKLKYGDIFNIDVTTILDGYYGDTSKMFSMGEISEEAKLLINVAFDSLEIGIVQSFPGNYFGNIGYEIGRFVHSKGFRVVRDYCGHGVGVKFHEEPQVDHIAEKNSGEIMKPGMIFTIEPMINVGTQRTRLDKHDGWTARTADNKLSAQFEHTILITNDGNEVLTKVESR
ncbi:MAG: type I methionyl aminopeptidase [Bacteroidia bacterium]|nr:type I methionyl aminopeptidase [Bacteroidia bacterium]